VVAAAGALAVASVVVKHLQKPQLRSQLALAGGVDYEIFDAEIIEIEPLDMSGLQTIDDVTLDLLQELSHEGLFSKNV
jgi:hypothetical protein